MGETSSVKEVVLYTDGACSGNPGPGGFGVVLLYGEAPQGAVRRISKDDQQPDGAAGSD